MPLVDELNTYIVLGYTNIQDEIDFKILLINNRSEFKTIGGKIERKMKVLKSDIFKNSNLRPSVPGKIKRLDVECNEG